MTEKTSAENGRGRQRVVSNERMIENKWKKERGKE